MSNQFEQVSKAIFLQVSANLIEGMSKILNDEGFELEPIEINIQGTDIGPIPHSKILEFLRAMAVEHHQGVTSTSTMNCADGDGAKSST